MSAVGAVAEGFFKKEKKKNDKWCDRSSPIQHPLDFWI